MTAREFIENLAPENSYWKINEGDLERLNEVAPTAENLYMVFECARCSSGDKNVFHAIPYTALKLDEDGFHNVYCGGMCVDFVDVDAIPTDLQEIFKNTQFENTDGDDILCKEDDCDEENTSQTVSSIYREYGYLQNLPVC